MTEEAEVLTHYQVLQRHLDKLRKRKEKF